MAIRAYFELFDFSGKKSAIELFDTIFEKDSLKGSFRKNEMNYEILQLSADSRYLSSVALKVLLRPNLAFARFFTFQ